MWLAVLFVGVFGADIVSSAGPGGSTSSVPVVVVLLPFVLPATIVPPAEDSRARPVSGLFRQTRTRERTGSRRHCEQTPRDASIPLPQ
jgi:hypothetical protein